MLTGAGGSVVPGAGEAWARERFRGPYLRDALLDAGALVETLETVAFWSALDALYAAVSAALRDALSARGTPPVVLCHISHVYPAGASLYFTVACAQLPGPARPVAGRQVRRERRDPRRGRLDHAPPRRRHRSHRVVPPGDRAARARRAARGQVDARPGGDPQPRRAPRARWGIISGRMTPTVNEHIRPLAELIVRFGANVQPGQIVALRSEPGKEELARAVAEVAYEAGRQVCRPARFRRVPEARPGAARRPRHARLRAAVVRRAGARARRAPVCSDRAVRPGGAARRWTASIRRCIGKDRLPSVAEATKVLTAGPRTGRSRRARRRAGPRSSIPELEPDAGARAAVGRDRPRLPARRARSGGGVEGAAGASAEVAGKLDGLALDALRLEGPGTVPEGRAAAEQPWVSGASAHGRRDRARPQHPHRGGVHHARPRAGRGHRHARPSRYSSRARRSQGCASGSRAAGRWRSTPTRAPARCARCAGRDDGASRLGEIALVDRDGRIGPLGTVFYDTLLDENAASHIALGAGLAFAVGERERHRPDEHERDPRRLHDRQQRGRRHRRDPRRRRGAAAARRRLAGLSRLATLTRLPGEVPERLNGRDWKSRNGG